jgi:hypothetical protein
MLGRAAGEHGVMNRERLKEFFWPRSLLCLQRFMRFFFRKERCSIARHTSCGDLRLPFLKGIGMEQAFAQSSRLASDKDNLDEYITEEEAKKLQLETEGRIWKWLQESSTAEDDMDVRYNFVGGSYRDESCSRTRFFSCFGGISLFPRR